MSQKFQESEFSIGTEDDLDLKAIFKILWQGKIYIVCTTIIFAVVFVMYAISQPNIYKSSVVLAASEQDQSSGLGGLASQFGGLASLAGVNLGGSSSNKVDLALEVIKSRKFITGFIEKHEILKDLMAANSWEPLENKLVYDSEIYDNEKSKWVRKVTHPYTEIPSEQEAYKKFMELIAINVDSESSIITISLEFLSPYKAQEWLNLLILDINLEMKARDVDEAVKSKRFLVKEIENTNISEIKTVLYKLIEEQTKTIMFANVRDEYVFKIIDPPIASEEKFKPKRAMISILGSLLGLILSGLFILFKAFLKRGNEA